MRKFTVIALFIIGVILVTVLFGSRYGIRIGDVTIAPNSELKELEDLTRKFWEDVQFKDFGSAASYHEPEIRKDLDIPYLLERLFLVKPEQLDIRTIDVQEVDIDSRGDRGRARTRLVINMLNTGRVEEPQIVVYWYKKNDTWFMRLESSLRHLEDKTKKKK